jgi:predicted CXXCH cytochrome family protein
MQVKKLALPLAAALSLLAGAAFQSSHQAKPAKLFTERVFAKAKADDYIGDKACAECHADEVNNFHAGHATFSADPSLPLDKKGCEGCHGPGKAHAAEQRGETPAAGAEPSTDPTIIGYSNTSAKDVSYACLRCHTDTMDEQHWHKTAHAEADVSCVSCHQIHPATGDLTAPVGDRGVLRKEAFPAAAPAKALLKADEATLCGSCHQSEVAKFRLQSHHPVPEGRMVCSDCHDIHPAKAISQGKGANQSVGSITESTPKHIGLLKDNCVTCHGDKAGPFAFEHDPVAGWTGRGCVECHNPHGSHNPKLLTSFSRGLCAECHSDKGANHFPGRTCWQAGCHVGIHGSNSDPQFLDR